MDRDEWITPAQAAQLSGLSSALVVALLSGGAFEGRAHKDEGGRWRLDATDFKRWLEKNPRPSDLPDTLAEVRSGLRVE